MSGVPATTSLVPRWLFAHRRAAVWIVGSAVVAAAVAAIALGYAAHPGAQPFEPQDPVVFIGSAAVIAAYGFVFAVLVSRVGENVVGWIFGVVALVLAISNLDVGIRDVRHRDDPAAAARGSSWRSCSGSR